MPPTPTFERIPPSLWDRNPPTKDTTAAQNLRALDGFLRGPRGHAHGLWGYTILRTVYTPGSDALVSDALDRLKSHIHWWCHHSRFTSFGALCERQRKDFREPNDELFRRFNLDVVEDREGLAHLDGDGDGRNADERFPALGEYFRRHVAGLDTGKNPGSNPRFCVCLILDSASVAALAGLPGELPPLRCAVDLKEKQDFLCTGHGGWVWLLEADYTPETGSDDEDGWYGPEDPYRGWMRIDVRDIENSWFSRLTRQRAPCFWHEERQQGSGVYWYTLEPSFPTVTVQAPDAIA